MTSKPSFLATNYCAFCYEQFPLDFVPGPNAWQSVVRAVLSLDVEGEDTIELTKSTYLPSNHCDVDVALIGRSRTKVVTISRELRVNQTCESDRLAFCFHSWCYSVLKWDLKWEAEDCFVPVIYKLARALAPDPSMWEDIQERRLYLDTARVRMLACYEKQPLLMSRLPTEIRTYIWRYTGVLTPYSAFVLVRTETSRLVRHLRAPLTRGLSQYQGPFLSASMVSVFGTEYIQGLMEDGESEGNRCSIGNATRLKYVISVGGLCAIQFLGVDWEGDWIGKIPTVDCAWYGIIRGEVSTLRYGCSDLNCTGITIAEPSTVSQVVWDQADFPSTLLDPDATLFDFDRDVMHFEPRSAQRRFFRYLSLWSKDEYTRGISVYISGHGIVGLEVHFTSFSRLSGTRKGCTLHLSFCPDERIAHVWLRVLNTPSSAFATPALVIETTRGRLHTFGSYIRPSMVIGNGYKWILLQPEGYITGLYHEKVRSGMAIMRLGVIGEGTFPGAAPRRPQYHNCQFPSPPIGAPNAGLFLSFAVLDGLERVDICRFKTRCTGLMIHYLDGRISVLGQWHSSCTSQRYCIYDGNGPAVTCISFEMSRYKDRHIVTEVSFTPFTAKAISDSEYRIFGVGEHIAWWCSERYDEVSRWTGELQDVPEESTMIQRV